VNLLTEWALRIAWQKGGNFAKVGNVIEYNVLHRRVAHFSPTRWFAAALVPVANLIRLADDRESGDVVA
jgi:hypothetical protein